MEAGIGMATTRLEALKSMVEQNPGDGFLRYGLAMEYRNGGDLEGSMAEFRALREANPDYAAAYFHGGQTLERLGLLEDAREWYMEGIQVTTRKGDMHALSEMQAALDLLG
jgi:tetratricopeptide (TPR) repeat protein